MRATAATMTTVVNGAGTSGANMLGMPMGHLSSMHRPPTMRHHRQFPQQADVVPLQWQADLTRFRSAIQCASIPEKSRDMVPAHPRAHGATDRPTQSPRPGIMRLAVAVSGRTPIARIVALRRDAHRLIERKGPVLSHRRTPGTMRRAVASLGVGEQADLGWH
jgi:hypothetical protein